jgi:hypothetical protein
MRFAAQTVIVAFLMLLICAVKAGNLTPGLYFMVNGANGMCLDLPSAKVSDQDGVVLMNAPTGGYTQKWDFINDPERPGRFLIKWHYGEKYLEPGILSTVPPWPMPVVHFTQRHDIGFQSWIVSDAGNGAFNIRNDGSGLFMVYPNLSDWPIALGEPGTPWTLQLTPP